MFTVVRLNLWINPIFDEKISALPNVHYIRLDLNAPQAQIDDAFRKAHVYQVSPARNELPAQFHVNENFLKKCPNLLLISSAGAGHDTVDVEACTKAGVAVVNQVGANADSVAELAIGLMLSVMRKIPLSHKLLSTSQGFTRESLMGNELRGKTLGLIGIGETGRRVAALGKAFGMKVLAYDPFLNANVIVKRGARARSFNDLLNESDIVSVHCPLDSLTRNFFDEKAFSQMKKSAVFITTARGGIHNEEALFKALSSGHLSGAGLDVWAKEPPPLDNPLLKLDNVIATFHTAGVTHEARFNVASWAADQIQGYLNGEIPPRLVNKEIWSLNKKRLT